MTLGAMVVAHGNADQASAWDGDEGAYWAQNADAFDRAVAGYDDDLFAAAGIAATDSVLDIGCGTGKTTRMAARRATHGSALGVDLSGAMIAEARRATLADGIPNARFEQLDAQIHAFPEAVFDVVISRTGAMFFADPVAAFTNIGLAMKPGGRLVLVVWQAFDRNEWMTEMAGSLSAGRAIPVPPPEVPSPFSMSDPSRVGTVLEAAGFGRPSFTGLTGSMDYGPDPDAAFDFIIGLAGWMVNGLDADGRAKALGQLRATIQSHHGTAGVRFGSAVWLITAQWPGGAPVGATSQRR